MMRARVNQSEDVIQHYIETYRMETFLNDDLRNHLQLFRFPAYSHVYIEQDKQHVLYFLVEGQVQCNHYHLNGRLAVIAISEPFSVIGDMEILTEQPVRSNVIATRRTVMLGIESEVVERYGRNDPRFLRFLIEQLREKLYKTNSLQVTQVLPVMNRLALYMLATQRSADGAIILPNKEELASLLGTTPRHLNRVLKEMVESGWIGAGYPRVRLLDQSALEALTT